MARTSQKNKLLNGTVEEKKNLKSTEPDGTPTTVNTKKYQLTIDAVQAGIVVDALDFYSRIGIGQLEEVANVFRWLCDPRLKDKHHELDIAKKLMDIAKDLLFNMPPGGSYGIHSNDVPDRYRVAWDIQKVIRHQQWLDHGTNEFCVDSDKPRVSSKDNHPLAEIKKVENE